MNKRLRKLLGLPEKPPRPVTSLTRAEVEKHLSRNDNLLTMVAVIFIVAAVLVLIFDR